NVMNATSSANRPDPSNPLVAPEIVPACGFDKCATSMMASSNMALTSMAREPSCTSTADGSNPGGGWNPPPPAGWRYDAACCAGCPNGFCAPKFCGAAATGGGGNDCGC